MSSQALVVGAAIAAATSVIAGIPLRRYAHQLGLLDAPNKRSSHRVITPRGGGLAIIFAAALAFWILSTVTPLGSSGWRLLAAAGMIGIIGGFDDRGGVRVSIRFAVQIAVAVWFVWSTGPINSIPLPPPLDAPLPRIVGSVAAVLWLVAVTNFFNFMDGLDGLATGQAITTCLGVALAAWSVDATAVAATTGGACLGFLFHNWPPARMFMGDSGSGFLGFTLAGLPLLAPAESRSHAMLVEGISLSLFLLDPLVTLFRRARAGKNVVEAHREHLYQQLVQPDESPVPVTTAYIITGLVLALLAAAAYRLPVLTWPAAAAGSIAFAVVWRMARTRVR